MPCCAASLEPRPEDHDRFACVGRLRALPRGRGRSPCLRHPGRGDARSQPFARAFVDRVHPGSPRAGRRLHGRRLRPADRARRRLPRHARPGRAEPRHRGRRRVRSTAPRSSRSPASARWSGCTRSPTSTSTSSRSCARSRSGTRASRSPEIIPEVVRKAFRVAESEKPGATHLELPEDVMAQPLEATPLPRRSPPLLEPAPRELTHAAELICDARSAGRARRQRRPARPRRPRAARVRPRRPACRSPRRSWARARWTTPTRTRWAPSACRSATTSWPASTTADVVIAVGYDLVEHAPEHWNPRRDKTIVVIDSVAAEIDAYYTPAVELLGDLYHVLMRLAEACRQTAPAPRPRDASRLHDIVLGHLEAGRDDDAFPVRPPRALWELRDALGPNDMLVSDVGLHKLWVARMFARARAEHRADRQRPGRDGLRAAQRDRRQARAPAAARRRGLRRRRRSHELSRSSRPRRAWARRSSRSSGRTGATARSPGSSASASTASTSARTSRTPTS